jgi:hypothetical protein
MAAFWGMLAGPGRAACASPLLDWPSMSFSKYFDHVAIGLSAICIVHCMAVPFVVAVLPLAAITFSGDTHFHELMLWVILPTSLLGFALGIRIHKRVRIGMLGALGLAVIVFAALWAHGAWPTWAELFVSIVGSVTLAFAHWRNFREVRRVHRHA